MMRRNLATGLLLILGCVIFLTLVSGCTYSRPDPETGVKAWITEVNHRNYASLYDLAPAEIRHQVSRDEFIKAQNNNTLLAPGNSFENYTILQRTVSGDTATLTAELILVTQDPLSPAPEKIPLFLKFVEYYENGEWKVWTAAP